MDGRAATREKSSEEAMIDKEDESSRYYKQDASMSTHDIHLKTF